MKLCCFSAKPLECAYDGKVSWHHRVSRLKNDVVWRASYNVVAGHVSGGSASSAAAAARCRSIRPRTHASVILTVVIQDC